MSSVPPGVPTVNPDPGQLLWIAGESYQVTRLADLPLFRSPVKLEKLTGAPATYYAADTIAGPICSCGDGGYCLHIAVLRSLGYLPPAKGLREEVEALFFGGVHQ